MTITYERVRALDAYDDGALYRLSEPVTYTAFVAAGEPVDRETAYVVVSAVVVPYTGAETLIFPANEAGEVLSWGELDGSYRGGLDHEQALRALTSNVS